MFMRGIRIKAIAILSASLASSALAGDPPDWTLKRSYETALKRSETIVISDEMIREAEGKYGQLLGEAFPEFFFSYELIWQDQSGLATGLPGSLAPSPKRTGAFGLRKNLLTGYKEISAIRGGGSYVRQRELEKLRAEQILLGDVARAFYADLRAELNVASLTKVVRLTRDRLKELKARERVGRTRTAEVLGTEVEAMRFESQLEEMGRGAEAARAYLGFLLGSPVEGVLRENPPSGGFPPRPDGYLERVGDRPDLRAKREELEVLRAAVAVARSGHFPGLDLGANYYVDRTGFQEPIDWDVTLGVGVPLWSWGAVSSSVDSAKAVLRKAEQEQSLLLRGARREIEDAHRNLLSARRQADLQRKVLELTEREYALQVRDYRAGLVTNLEVLSALNRLSDAEFAYTTARLVLELAWIDLRLAAGKTPREILE